MSEFKGTKGKWVYNKDYLTIDDEFGYCIAQQNGIHNSKNWEYDAQLIITAHEMLEMLIKCREYFLLKTDSKSEERAEAIGELIKKATTL